MELGQLLVLLLISNIHSGHTEERPQGKVTIKPDQHVFRGETVTLRCDIDGEGVTSWQYSWYKDGSASVSSKLQEHTFWFVSKSDAGKYSCYGAERGGSRRSQHSDEVTLTVSDRAQAVLSVSPQKWLTEGDPVTLICEVNGSSTGWTFSWYTETVLSDFKFRHQLLSDSSRGAGGNYTVSSAALKHTGVYVCGAERGEPAYYTAFSNTQLIWVTDYSPPVSLIISPNRTQHFTSVSLCLSCEDQSNSHRWTVRRYTDSGRLEDCSSFLWGSQTESTCTIRSTITSDTGVYWCQSKSGEKSHPVNITVHSGVILESPVHPVTEGDTLTLYCLYQHSTPPNLRADFYKDGSLIQNQTTQMIISNVSKTHEGFYDCKHPERGESPKSWISVTERPKAKVTINPDEHVSRGDTVTQHSNAVTLTVSVDPKTKVTIKPDQHVFRGETVTLRCDIDGEGVTSWQYSWYKDGSADAFSEQQEHTFRSVTESDAGKYSCYGAERGGSHRSHISDAVTLIVSERPKAKVTIKPDQHVFRGETVTLRCDTDGEGVTNWQYSWYKDSSVSAFSELQEHTFNPVTESDTGEYSCDGEERGRSQRSQHSDSITLTLSDRAQAVLSVSPQKWLTEGDSVTLICKVNGTSTGWTFSWFTLTVSSDTNDQYKLLSDSGRGAGGNYTVSSAALKHTGVYVCRAERGKPAYYTTYSNKQPLWVTGVSPPVSLIISPNRTQHFTSVSLSLSCEDQSISDRWTVRRYTDRWWLKDCSSSVWGSQTGSTCTINSTNTSDTGVYWCQSKSGENSHPVNITVHCESVFLSGSLQSKKVYQVQGSLVGVILESPVHPVTEGDTLTLHCLYQHSTPPNLRADFYKDGSLIQNQTTEMIISTVSKSHEGFYYCKHPERGESPKSWISVRAFDSLKPMIIGVTAGLTVTFSIIVFLVLLWRYRINKGSSSAILKFNDTLAGKAEGLKAGGWSPSRVNQQKNRSQTSEQNQSEEIYKTLQSGQSESLPMRLYNLRLKPKCFPASKWWLRGGSIFNWLAGAVTGRSRDLPVAGGSCQSDFGRADWQLPAGSMPQQVNAASTGRSVSQPRELRVQRVLYHSYYKELIVASTGSSVSQPRERSELIVASTGSSVSRESAPSLGEAESDRERVILTDLKRLRLPATSPPLAGHVTCQNQTGSCHLSVAAPASQLKIEPLLWWLAYNFRVARFSQQNLPNCSSKLAQN
ncbi:Fc receptor-like protein 5 [Labeo rohita]|uniref:Fc receptor-like protein 5 n=1 Tax=Labeo rohita TaxID=84645 RepID=A0ABQ8MTS6_LABRO|nr:Fc receptor-like protein 5 [Labeo rohita]